MKKYFYFLIAASIAFTMQSCDFVTNPVENATPANNDTTGGIVVRKVLLEDYTGHKCTACPQAAIVAQNLLTTHGNKLVVVGVHAGFFASPSSSGSNYLYDFRTSAGNTYNTFFGLATYPSGLINRKFYPASTTTFTIPHGSWAQEVATELNKPALAKIEIKNTYNINDKELSCEVKSTFLQDTLTGGPYRLIVMLTQDSIIGNQLDNGTLVPAYVHQHVLRDNLNGTWGELITTVPVTKNTPITKTYTYTFPNTYPAAGGTSATNCDVDNCHIVAFLYNDATKEVIQVEEKHVTH